MIQRQYDYEAYIKANGVGSNDKVANSCKSYISYLNSIQRHLNMTISAQSLSTESDIYNISERLKNLNTLSDKTIKNYGSAMKQYAAMVSSF